MHTLDEKVSPITYIFAVVAGMVCLPLTLVLARYLWDVFDIGALGSRPLGIIFALTPAAAACYGLAGAAFGLAKPERGWRWGVWLTALPACLGSYFLADEVWSFLLLVALTLAPACAGAYVAARAHLKHTRVI